MGQAKIALSFCMLFKIPPKSFSNPPWGTWHTLMCVLIITSLWKQKSIMWNQWVLSWTRWWNLFVPCGFCVVREHIWVCVTIHARKSISDTQRGVNKVVWQKLLASIGYCRVWLNTHSVQPRFCPPGVNGYTLRCYSAHSTKTPGAF